MKKFILSLSMAALLVAPVFVFANQATDELIQQLQAQIAALQAQIAALQNGSGFHDGDQVQVDANFLKIRADAGVQALILGKAPRGATGVIRCNGISHDQCPATKDNYTWWYVDWDNSVLPSGWSAEGTSEADFLTKVSKEIAPLPSSNITITNLSINPINPAMNQKATLSFDINKNVGSHIDNEWAIVVLGPPDLKVSNQMSSCVAVGPGERCTIRYDVIFAQVGQQNINVNVAPVGVSQNSSNATSASITATVGSALTTIPASIIVLSPNQGMQGQNVDIVITGSNFTGANNFSGNGISPVSDRGFQLISSQLISDGQINARFSIAANATVGVRNITVTTPNGTSNDAPFSVVSPTKTSSVTILSPNGGETWQQGTQVTIKWNATNLGSGFVGINLLKDGVGFQTLGTAPILNTGSYVWIVPSGFDGLNFLGSNFKIRILNNYDPNISDESDAPFSIVAAPASPGAIQVSIDPSTPQTQLAFQAQLTRFTAVYLFSPVDVTLDCWRVKVNGVADLGAFVGAAVMENTEALVDGKFPFGSDRIATACGQAGTPWHPISLFANQPKIVWLVVRMANDLSPYAGQVFSIGLDGFQSTPALGGSGYPLTGNNMTINSSLRVVDLKINNSDGPLLTAKSGDALTLIWTAANGFSIGSCLAMGSWYGARPLSGNETVAAPIVTTSTGTSYIFECTSENGLTKFRDSIQVNISPLPDLAFSFVVIEPNAATKQIQIKTEIQNLGYAPAVNVGLKIVNVTTGRDMGGFEGLSLAVGQKYLDTRVDGGTLWQEICTRGGTNTLSFQIDPKNIVAESNEINNVLEQKVVLSVANCGITMYGNQGVASVLMSIQAQLDAIAAEIKVLTR